MNTEAKTGFDQNADDPNTYWLYILSNSKPSGPLYLGDTDDLILRMDEHKLGLRRDYAHYHRLDRLVYFEVWHDHDKFIARLRRVRNWPRDMRLLLIESLNADWNDLLPELLREKGKKAGQADHVQERAA